MLAAEERRDHGHDDVGREHLARLAALERLSEQRQYEQLQRVHVVLGRARGLREEGQKVTHDGRLVLGLVRDGHLLEVKGFEEAIVDERML